MSKGNKRVNEVTLQKKIRLMDFIQSPYKGVDLQRFEAAARRNWAIKSAISVRQFFVFGKGSELIIELPERITKNMNELQKKQALVEIEKEFPGLEDAVKKIEKLDEKLKLVEKLPILYWQSLVFGRGLIIKLFDESDENLITRLFPINTRRLGDPILDRDEDMSFEGVFVDGQPLDRKSMIYAIYDPVQISPHTEGFGYTPLEPIIHVAEGLNIFYEEDVKEIQRSAWLASILLEINTAGLTRPQARARIKSIIDEIKPAKYIGINQMGVNAQQLNLQGDLNGVRELAENSRD